MSDIANTATIELSLTIIGLVTGFIAVKINLVLIVLGGRLFSSGRATGRYFVIAFFGFLAAFAALNLSSALDLATIMVSSVLFSLWLLLGEFVGHRRTRLKDFRHIMSAILDTSFPEGYHQFPGAVSISSVSTSETLVHRMPYSLGIGLQLFIAIFDSRTMVFLGSLRRGKLRWKRFVNLSPKDRKEYLNYWRYSPQLSIGAQIIRILTSYAYYVKDQTWPLLKYSGHLLEWSYLD